jgi:hypothetical protein
VKREERSASTTGSSVDAALAFLMRLPPAVQHAIYEHFHEAQAVPHNEQFMHRRASRVTRALHEARHLLGRAPTVREYEDLRRAHPQCEWPTARSVPRWLGVRGWNNALALAGIEAVVEGDYIECPGPQAYRPDELISALQECAVDLGQVPGRNDYFAWRRRPDVEQRPGRRPRSYNPFDRVLGSFREARIAAGLVDADAAAAPAVQAVHALIRLPKWGIGEDEVLEHIRLVVERVGGPMTASRYERERRAIFAETSAKGHPVALASIATVYRHFRFWSKALEAAMVTVAPQRRPSTLKPPRVYKFTDDQMLRVVSEAHDAMGGAFTCEAYKRWRDAVATATPQRRAMLPHATTVRKHFGSWMIAVDRMYEWRRSNA